LYRGPKKLRSDVKIILEPGRLIAAPAGTLITKVIYLKKRNHKKFIIVDAGMNDFMRTALYQAQHQITPLQKEKSKYDFFSVVGPVCESSDYFSKKTKLPVDTASGDLLAIHDVGAYGASMSSHYNTRPKVAEVLITENGKMKLIRKRETFEDLIKQEKECL
jgi:diaminopimelate decarboxylase